MPWRQFRTKLMGSIQRVSDIVAEITATTMEQSSGVRQVGEAVAVFTMGTKLGVALRRLVRALSRIR